MIGAYQHLLDWHQDWYAQNIAILLESGEHETSPKIRKLLPSEYTAEPQRTGNKRKRKRNFQSLPICQVGKGSWILTADEKKRILLNNIYGVDIDPQAVEVTKLSLLLKVLEGESRETIKTLIKFSGERALPDLGNNIKCGNSLVEWDILRDYPNLPDEIRPFDWSAEFPDAMLSGGFDAVIGNPPYVRQESLGRIKEYFKKHYKVYHGIADLYVYFIERGISLLRNNGIFSYIVANKWMGANYGKPLRRWLKNQCIEEIVDFKDLSVFQKATTYPCIMRVSKNPPFTNFKACQIKTLNFTSVDQYIRDNSYLVDQGALDSNGWSLADSLTQALLDKLKTQGTSLGCYVDKKMYRGITTGLNEAFIIDAETKETLIAEDPRSTDVIKPLVTGREIKRYHPHKSNRYLICIPWHFPLHDDQSILSANEKAESLFKERFPAIYSHMLKFKFKLLDRDHAETGIKYEWYVLQRPKLELYSEFEKPKIIFSEIASRGQFTMDLDGRYPEATTYLIGTDSKYLLGILNSKLWTFILSKSSSEIRGGFYRWKQQYMSPLPIPKIDFSNQTDIEHHNHMTILVESMLDLNKRLAESQTTYGKTMLQRQIEATDRQIDALVYKLYGLTEAEIKIVEGGMTP